MAASLRVVSYLRTRNLRERPYKVCILQCNFGIFSKLAQYDNWNQTYEFECVCIIGIVALSVGKSKFIIPMSNW